MMRFVEKDFQQAIDQKKYVIRCFGTQYLHMDYKHFKQRLHLIGLFPTEIQLKKLFYYATVPETNQKVKPTSKLEITTINIEQMATWLIKNIDFIKVAKEIPQKPKRKDKLPVITKSKLQRELQPLIQIFDKMQQARQQSGLIPVQLNVKSQNSQDEIVQIPFKHIPYDPDLYQLNKKLNAYRVQAQVQIKKLIQMAKEDPKIRQKIEVGIRKFQKQRVIANEKVGREGAKIARKRLISRKRQSIHKNTQHLKMMLAMGQDTIKAGKIYQLLNCNYKPGYPVY